MNLKTLSSKQSKQLLDWLIAAFLGFGFTGLIDSAYLTAKYYSGSPLECQILIGCDIVATSQYAEIFHAPVALLGVIYYLLIVSLIALYVKTKKENVLIGVSFLTIFGFLASLWFLYLQLFVIKALCFYCIVSAAASTALFISGIIFIRKFNAR
ncbi:MAG: hypothetical protein A3H02_02035 [Candidatus Niyogibacteria bacterium RIFCSPLOWO2_12_FULL_41_13]|uniref:Vitamin K epoxide reductase domain-containing protein n=1 Tax=Candidatus Niyogibacteria bacterium RIFCSPLOWO2_12_FULL_41_13 TaxID=1801726 RepID=A0A1G2F564_9BACT|nr:MAG: hypothetical protein A3H02_02035 [Candidatus Niyogibacteria bacterium RIFCSPLOWO2_12_FULL_41_13]